MKKLASLALIVSLFSQNVFAVTTTAPCDWTQIKSNSDGTYIYNAQLNLCVGQLVQQNKIQLEQIADYQKAITLKDLALTQSDQRAQMWSTTSDQLENRIQAIDSAEKHNEVLYFGLGVLTTFLAAYGAAQIIHR
jgi:hypothetical protein